ncbi:MAG: hypothetical protein R3B84_24080 [Zavarzinella sp.]
MPVFRLLIAGLLLYGCGTQKLLAQGADPKVPPKKEEKKDEWPSIIEGKTVDQWIAEMNAGLQRDPSARERACFMIPQFGPKAGESDKLGPQIIQTMTVDPDFNVRIAALALVPLFGFKTVQQTKTGMGVVERNFLNSPSSVHLRYEGVSTLAAMGPHPEARKLMTQLIARTKDLQSWQVRRNAVFALGQVGQGWQPSEEDLKKGAAPIEVDARAVQAILYSLRDDGCEPVRRQAINSLLTIGPVPVIYLKDSRDILGRVSQQDRSMAIRIWADVFLIKYDPDGAKMAPTRLLAISKNLAVADDVELRVEACSALAYLGEDAKARLQDLIAVMSDAQEKPQVIIAAIGAATTMKSLKPTVLRGLEPLTKHSDENVKKAAEEAIKYLKEEKEKPVMKK